MNSEIYFSNLNVALAAFSQINLADMPEEVLMERLDRKYAFHISRCPEIISQLTENYLLINAEGLVISPYNSLYFDTPEKIFYQNHQRGFKNRIKIRYRSYPHTKTTFLEAKFKNNKSVTTKERVLTDGMNWPFSVELKNFIKEQVPNHCPDALIPTARIDYDRIGFIANSGEERFSLDFNIRFSMGSKSSDFGSLAILEVKQEHIHSSPVVRRMRQLGLSEFSLSKYCMAMSALDPALKSNNFKPVFKKIQKINHVK
jgi:hypothetical protein